MHLPAQVFAVVGQAHVPEMHANPPQLFPQAPQLSGSRETSTHLPPHVMPVVHVHLPEMQALPAPQALPHAPQLVTSFETSLHAPPQFTRPVGQLALQTPAPQT